MGAGVLGLNLFAGGNQLGCLGEPEVIRFYPEVTELRVVCSNLGSKSSISARSNRKRLVTGTEYLIQMG